jgi:hypothetical protein
MRDFKTFTVELCKRRKIKKRAKPLKFYNKYNFMKGKKEIESKMKPILLDQNSVKNVKSESANSSGNLSLKTFNPRIVESQTFVTEDEEEIIQKTQKKMYMENDICSLIPMVLNKRVHSRDFGQQKDLKKYYSFKMMEAEQNHIVNNFQFKEKRTGQLINDDDNVYTECVYVGNFGVKYSENKFILERKYLKTLIGMGVKYFREKERERTKVVLQREMSEDGEGVNSDEEMKESK